MNCRAGDTTASTKASTTTKPVTTTITTSSSRAMSTTTAGEQQRSGGRSAPRSDTKAAATATRKRRQPDKPDKSRQLPMPLEQQRRQAASPFSPPPEKSRHGNAEQPSSAGRSRLGGFFSTLASRIRRAKSSDYVVAPVNQENKKNRQVDSDKVEMDTHTRKVSPNAGTDDNTVKRRKIEYNEDAGLYDVSKETSNDTEKSSDTPEVANAENVSRGNEPTADIEIEPNTALAMRSNDTEILDICREIVATMTQKIESAEQPCDSVTNGKPIVLSSEIEHNEAKKRLPAASDSLISMGKRKYNELKADLAAKSSWTSIGSATTAPRSCGEEEGEATRCRSTLRLGSGRSRKDDLERLRKTIQWLEEGSRRLREELAGARAELHEERKAAKQLRRESEAAVREARSAEAAKFANVVSELRARLRSQSPSRTTNDFSPNRTKSDLLKEENHKREIMSLKNRLSEAELIIQKLKIDSLDRPKSKRKNKDQNLILNADIRKLQTELQSLRAANKKLEEKLQIAEESARTRAAELRAEHERHETEMASLQKALRSDTIKMIDEIQSKNREIEKLEKLVNQSAQINEKLRTKEDETMRKLRESERSHPQTRLAPRLEEKIHRDEDAVHKVVRCKVECEDEAATTELDRLRELAIEQQEVIEVLRQAVKEKDRKLGRLTNKRRQDEYYKQWLELEPVAEVEVEDDEQHEGDSALSSAPPSLSPQPGSGAGCRSCGQNGSSAVSRESYESVLLEIEELQTKLLEEQSELGHAKSQVRDLEKALLQETRGSQTSRLALSEKLRVAEEREASLLAEISELREQNELLEFRVLELEESPNPRDTPDPADSGIVSPEPIHLYKDHQTSKHRDRAVATVIPYTSTFNHPIVASDAPKAPLSLQESGIFEEEDVEYDQVDGGKETSKLSSQSTQTEAPAGELLQEVQRLQELRARIQERAVKLPLPVSPTGNRKHEAVHCDLDVAAPLHERIRELEQKLSCQESERQVSKQREEELLDENYRLTERLYYLQAELRNLEEKFKAAKPSRDAEVMTEVLEPPTKSDACQQYENQLINDLVPDRTRPPKCQNLYAAKVQQLDEETDETDAVSIEHESTLKGSREQPCSECSELWRDCEARLQQLGRTEFCLRQQVAGLEQREAAFFETLRQADATWARLEADYEAKMGEMSERLTAQVELNRSLFEQFKMLNRSPEELSAIGKKSRGDEAMEVETVSAYTTERSVATTQTEEEGTMEKRSCRCRGMTTSLGLPTISRTSIKLPLIGTTADVTQKTNPEPPTEVAIEAKEEDGSFRSPVSNERQLQQQRDSEGQNEPSDTLASSDDSTGDKKQIIYFRWR